MAEPEPEGAGCSQFNGSYVGDIFTGSVLGFGFNAGDVLTFTVTDPGQGLAMSLFDSSLGIVVQSTSVSFSYTVPAATPAFIALLGSFGAGGNMSWFCVPAAATPTQQVSNARTAVINGQQAMRSFNDWIHQGVIGGFGMIGGNGVAAAPQPPSAADRLAALEREERALREEHALRPHDAELTRRLDEVRNATLLARADARMAVDPADAGRGVEVMAFADTGRDTRRALPTTFGFASRDLLAQGRGSAPAMAPGTRWNVWGEGRIIGAWDNLANARARGLLGAAGVDYHLTPWMTAGISIGVESFDTRFRATGQKLDSIGVSAVPYVGFRIADNIYASAFVGLTHISYDGVPTPGTTSDFTAFRVFFGGTVTGHWRSGNINLRPTLSAAYGFENQRAYTDSAGTFVGAQTVQYGRVSVGPEIGYVFAASDGSWSIEPLAIARAQLDFASSNSTALGGQSVLLRSGVVGSGQAGLGVNASFAGGYYLRARVTYDSLFVSGLNLVSGSLRAGMRF